MKKLIILSLILITFFLNCKEENNSESMKPQGFKVESFLKNVFNSRFMNYENNMLVKKDAVEYLSIGIDSLMEKGELVDIPLELFRIQKNKHGSGAIVQFTTNNTKDDDVLYSPNLNYDIIGFYDLNDSKKLIENEKYYVYGKYVNRLKKNEVYSMVNLTNFGPDPEIEIQEYRMPKFKAGIYFIDIDSLELF